MDAVDWLVQNALWLAFAALMLLAGAGIGYYTRAKDEADDKASRWDEGYTAGSHDQIRFNSLGRPVAPTDNPYRARTPFVRRTKKAGVPSA